MANTSSILRLELGDSAMRVQTHGMPSIVLRIVAMFGRTLRFISPLLSRKHVFSPMLDWKPRPADTMIVDSARGAFAIRTV